MGKRRRKKNKSGKERGPRPDSNTKADAPQKKKGISPSPIPLEGESITYRGMLTIGGGVGVLALGFFVLTLTDPAGSNWASHVSPLLILGGYAVIAAGIFLPDPKPLDESVLEALQDPSETSSGPVTGDVALDSPEDREKTGK